MHPKESPVTEEQGLRLAEQCYEIALAASRAADVDGLVSSLESIRTKTAELRALDRQYERARQQQFPWIFNPFTWRLRARRNRQRRVVARIKPELRAQFGLLPRAPGP